MKKKVYALLSLLAILGGGTLLSSCDWEVTTNPSKEATGSQ